MKKVVYHLVFSSLIIINLSAQNYYSISGFVFDKSSEAPLAGVNVFIKDTQKGAMTDSEGTFIINHIAPGNLTLVVQHIGYATQKIALTLENKNLTGITFVLQEEVFRTDEIVVSATRNEKYRRDVPIIVNVVDKVSFKTSQSLNVAEGLSFIPGVRMENNCQNCGFSQVRLNGLQGPYSQILIDSRPVFSALNGVYGLEQIPSSMVQRVEVIRGGGSALFGSNAIAGVINIITAEPNALQLNFNTQFASIARETDDFSYNLDASYVNQDRVLGLTFFANKRDRQQYDNNNDGFSELPLLDNKAVGMRGFYRTTHNSKLTMDAHWLSEDRRGGNAFNREPHLADIAEALTHNVYGGGLTYEHFFSEKRLQKLAVYITAQYTDRQSYYGSGQDPNAYGTTNETIMLGGAQYSHAFNDGWLTAHEITLGAEVQSDKLHDQQTGYGRDISQKVYQQGLFIQDDWKITHNHTFLFGVRLDKHNRLNDIQVNPRANLLIDLYPQLQLRMSFASGFRAPQAFDEDLHIANAGDQKFNIIKLSPDLKAEKSNSLSLSLDYSNNLAALPWGLTLEVFYTRLHNVFINTFVSETEKSILLEKRNGAGAMVYGSTLEGRLYATRTIELQAGLTLQKALYDDHVEWTDGLYSKHILRTPRIYGFYLARWEAFEDFNLSLSGVFTGSMYAPHFAGYINEDRLEHTSSFLETNLKLSYNFHFSGAFPDIELFAGAYNLFNQYQRDFDKGIQRDAGYIYGPNRPRTLYAGCEFSMD